MVSMASLCIFAFRIKILNANPCAVLFFIFLLLLFFYLIVQTTAVNIVAEKRFWVLLSPNNFSRSVCHSKIARQVERNISMCNDRQHLNLVPWISPLILALDNLWPSVVVISVQILQGELKEKLLGVTKPLDTAL